MPGLALPTLANVANLLAALRAGADDLNQAEDLCRRSAAVPPGEDLTRLHLQSLRSLATVLRRLGRHAEAERCFADAMELTSALGPDDPDTIATENELGILYKYTWPVRRGRRSLPPRLGRDRSPIGRRQRRCLRDLPQPRRAGALSLPLR